MSPEVRTRVHPVYGCVHTSGMEPFAGVAALAGLVAIFVFESRRRANGQTRWAWVFFAPTGAVLLYLVWIAVRSWPEQPFLALFLGVIGVPSLLLFIRSARKQVSGGLPSDPKWTLSSAEFDYIVWTAIAVPFVVVVFLPVLLVTGGFATQR
jgi:hypothetical protein